MVAINTNIASLLAQNNSRIVNNELEKSDGTFIFWTKNKLGRR